MTYNDTLTWMYSRLPMFSRIGDAALKPDLKNTLALCARLGDPHKKFKSVHVAGTNGKGSTCAMLAAILQEAGYKVGLHTSPHIKDFKERIRVNGVCVSEQFVVDFIERMKSCAEEIEPSFFELTVAMAFEYFHAQQVDVAIIETGLGGLLDSTNVITPILSVITNIGTDHAYLLGDSREKIALQKAGIIKQNVPVVIGEASGAVADVFRHRAAELNAEICFTEEKFIAEFVDPEGELLFCNVKNTETGITEKLRVGLAGFYQAKNVCTVMACCKYLKRSGFEISEEALHSGLENVKRLTDISGRWDVIGSHPTTITDVAHNKEGIEQVLLQVNAMAAPKVHFILGFVKDKALDDVLVLFPDNAAYYFTNAHIPRALPADELAAKAKEKDLRGDVYENVNLALATARAAADEQDLIMICGSFFIIGELSP